MRWWREFRNPTLKCERLGHSMKARSYQGYEKSTDRWCVAYSVRGKMLFCSRCGIVQSRTVDDRHAIHSLTLDRFYDDRLHEKGFVEL